MTTSKLDLKKDLRALYTGKPGNILSVTPGTHTYLCCDGIGDPNTSHDYKDAVEALFSVSYQAKFDARKNLGIDYAVMPLEGLWWSDSMEDFATSNKARWQWTMMILQPSFITQDHIVSAKATVEKRRAKELRSLELREHTEDTSAQTMHLGPFSDEGPTIAAVHTWIQANRHALTGKHHEIYLTDIRRAAPSRWKTLIRQPYR